MTIKQAFEKTIDGPTSTRAKVIADAMINSGFSEPKKGYLEKVLFTAMRLSTEESISKKYIEDDIKLIEEIYTLLTRNTHYTPDSSLKYDIDKYLTILGHSSIFNDTPIDKRQAIVLLNNIILWRSKIKPE
jgi:hypothetical protein